MAKASKKIRKAMMSDADKAAKTARDIGVPEAQIARGFALHKVTEGGQTIGQTIRILYPCIVDRWLAEGGPGFDDPQRRAIDHCRSLWKLLGTQRVVANYDGGIGGGGGGGNESEIFALAQLSHYKQEFLSYWDIFEGIVRFELPAGTAGSHLANNPAQAIASAKACVGFIASKIAEARGY